MAKVHELLVAKDRSSVLDANRFTGKWDDQIARDRRAISAASNYLAEDGSGIGFLFSGFAQAGLPHRGLPLDAVWEVQTERVSLLVEPGRRKGVSGDFEWTGVPYGSRARLIMLYLQTEALRTQCREVELGRSLNAWLRRLEIPIGGKSFRDVREQAERISRCHLSFHIGADGRRGLINQSIVDTVMFVDDGEARQGALFVETARLSETFYEQLRKHPLPIEEVALRHINNNSMALDAYCWLTYRLHALRAPCSVTWKALHAQFGTGFARLDHFRPRFIDSLTLAMAVYPDAKVDVTAAAVVLSPSRPPVAPTLKQVWLPSRAS